MLDEATEHERTRVVFTGLAFFVEIQRTDGRYLVGLPLEAVVNVLSQTAEGVQ